MRDVLLLLLLGIEELWVPIAWVKTWRRRSARGSSKVAGMPSKPRRRRLRRPVGSRPVRMWHLLRLLEDEVRLSRSGSGKDDDGE